MKPLCNIEIEPVSAQWLNQSAMEHVGRLSRPPNPVLFKLLYEPALAHDLAEALPCLLSVDAAHVVMLAHTGLLPGNVAASLLRVNRELRDQLICGENPVVPRARHRGFYFLYEQEYIDRLGVQIGGAAHMARSRNDINATLTRMRFRDQLLEMLDEFCKLANALAAVAGKHSSTLLCGFTHMQPAQPTTLGHYLAGVLSELQQSAENLNSAYEQTNCSPMGAAAGFGTSFPINRGEVAQLLGFDALIPNSADAVASRQYLAHALSAMAMMGVTLTRLATDFQTWSSAAYGFLRWSDDLVSTSSIMPQKRNAFVWENIKGKAISPLGSLMNTLTGMKNVSFSNTVEISTETSSHVWPATQDLTKAIGLVRLLIENLEVQPDRMHEFLADKQTTMTAVADFLVTRHGLAFRSAHDVVGRLVNQYPLIPPADELRFVLRGIIAEVEGVSLDLDAAELALVLDPMAAAQAAMHGGGPSPAAVQAQIHSLTGRIALIQRQGKLRRQSIRMAELHLRQAAEEIICSGI